MTIIIPSPIEEKIIRRFWSRVAAGKPDECWCWIGSKTPLGYGHMRIGKQNAYSHRISWVLHNGFIPDGLVVCHKCDNPSCVNPTHLFLGTMKDNTQDSIKKGRWHFKPKMTSEDRAKKKGKTVDSRRKNVFRGVFHLSSGHTTRPWRAYICIGRKTIHLGNYATQEEAARKYDIAVIEYKRDLSRLNFPVEVKQ
jgi:hypothetical protein